MLSTSFPQRPMLLFHDDIKHPHPAPYLNKSIPKYFKKQPLLTNLLLPLIDSTLIEYFTTIL